MSIQLEAIVLKSFDYQEHHKIVKMISPSHGLISVFINYANKKKSRMLAIAEPLTCVLINVKESNSQTGGLFFLQHGDVIDPFYEIKMEYDLIMLFYEMAQIIVRGDIEEIHLPYIYRTLKAILSAPFKNPSSLRYGVVIFKAKITASLGIAPMVDCCVGCGGIKNIITASATEGGLICQSCYKSTGIWIKPDLVNIWRALFKSPVDKLLSLEISDDQLEILEIWFKSYYEFYSNIRYKRTIEI